MRYLTSGESHGPQLTAIIEGLPSGLPLAVESLNEQLARRQHGYGRGDRMKIERDTASIVSGVRWGATIGSPVTLVIRNKDWENWLERMSPLSKHLGMAEAVTRPRPGHADLCGAMKYDHRDVRNILERSSARETAARVAVGSVARAYLTALGIRVGGVVRELGGVVAAPSALPHQEQWTLAAQSELFCCDAEAEHEMKRMIDHAKSAGDTLGGVVEVQVLGLPPGLGSHVQWDRKLDGRLAGALMSIQAIKGVEIGLGFEVARRPGSKVHDEIAYNADAVSQGAMSGYVRPTNNAGGLEGGMTNGQPLIVRAAMKPIPTLYTPLQSVDIETREAYEASVERSDTCAVPAALVVAEAVVCIELVTAMQEKFGGDSLAEVQRNLERYLEHVKNF